MQKFETLLDSKLNVKIDQIKSELTTVKNNLASLDEKVADIRFIQMDSLSTDLNNLTGSIQNMQTDLEKNKDSITEFKTEILEKISSTRSQLSTSLQKIETHRINSDIILLNTLIMKNEEQKGGAFDDAGSQTSPLLPLLANLETNEYSFKKTVESYISIIRCHQVEDGFYWPDTNQCFKLFNDEGRTWEEGKSNCEANQLVYAEIPDATAVSLRKHIVDTYGGSVGTWVGARRLVAYGPIKWLRSEEEIFFENPLWWNPQSYNYGSCLRLLTITGFTDSKPDKPYHSNGATRNNCSEHKWSTLCEMVLE